MVGVCPCSVRVKKPVALALQPSSLKLRGRASREVARRVKATLFVLGGVAFFFLYGGEYSGDEFARFGFGLAADDGCRSGERV